MLPLATCATVDVHPAAGTPLDVRRLFCAYKARLRSVLGALGPTVTISQQFGHVHLPSVYTRYNTESQHAETSLQGQWLLL